MTASVHDHHIRQLTVDVPERTIRLTTAYPESTGADSPVDALALYREYAAEMQRVYGQRRLFIRAPS